MDKSLKLRFRFYNVTNKSIDIIKKEFEDLKTTIEPDFKIKIIDNHIWLSIGVLKREKHSPQLHLELEEMEHGNTAITGLYGPDPVLWTMFMFLHFIVAGIFIIFGMIVYSKWTLKENFGFEIVIMMLMIGLWIALYYIARTFRKKGIPQMKELEEVMDNVLN